MFCNICLFLEKGIYETSSVLATLGHLPQGGRSLGGIYEASSGLAVVVRNKEIYKEAVEK